MLTENQLSQIEEIYNNVKDYCLCVILYGSYCLDYLNNHHDIDVLFVCNNVDNIRKLRYELRVNNRPKSRKLFEEEHISIIPKTRESLEENMYVYSYMYNLDGMKILFGDTSFKDKIKKDVFKYKEEYLNNLKFHIDCAYEKIEEEKPITKLLYHIISVIYILKNKKYQFNKTQIKNINLCHDAENQKKMKELLDWARDEVNEMLKEYNESTN